MIVWIIGLSGAGKTTIGTLVYNKMKSLHSNTVHLDGDYLRDVWGDNLGHSLEAREKNFFRIAKFCKMLEDQGINVICSTICQLEKWREWNQQNFNNYKQIYLNASINLVEKRDNKDIYSRAKVGKMPDVAGVDLPYDQPQNSTLTVSNEKLQDKPEAIAELIWSHINSESLECNKSEMTSITENQLS